MAGVEAYAGDSSGTLSLTNSSVNLTSDKETTTADGNQVTNNISLSASTIDAGALGAPFGPASVFGSLPGENVVFAGISLNNLQFSPAPAEATQYSAGPGAYLQGDTISNTSAVVSNSLLTAEAHRQQRHQQRGREWQPGRLRRHRPVEQPGSVWRRECEC